MKNKTKKEPTSPRQKRHPLTPAERHVLAKLFRERFSDEELADHPERCLHIDSPMGGKSVVLYLVGGEDRD